MENWAVFLVVLSFGIACYYELNLIRHSLNEHSLSLEGLRRALERIEAHVGSLPNPFAAAETEQGRRMAPEGPTVEAGGPMSLIPDLDARKLRKLPPEAFRALAAQTRQAAGNRSRQGAEQNRGGFHSRASGCVIKGNVSSSGKRFYHVPGGQYYENTEISAATGERWFCTEAEAIAAGWRKARRGPTGTAKSWAASTLPTEKNVVVEAVAHGGADRVDDRGGISAGG